MKHADNFVNVKRNVFCHYSAYIKTKL